MTPFPRETLIWTCSFVIQCSFVESPCSIKLRHDAGIDDIKSLLPFLCRRPECSFSVAT